jgi:hypothetical protein
MLGALAGTAIQILQVSAKEAGVGRKGRGKGSRGGSEGRVRGRVRERVQGHAGRGGQGVGRKRGSAFDVGDIEGYAKRLSGSSGGGTSALAGAASGLAGGGFASRFLAGGDAQGPDEDFRAEIVDQLSLLDERLQRLEEQMTQLLGEPEGDLTEPGGVDDPASNP